MSLPESNPIRTVLAATDLSPASEPAVRAACALARKADATLHLITVVPHPTQVPFDQFAESLVENLRTEHSSEMKKLVESLPEERPGRLREVVREGDAVEAILQEIEEVDADLLVIGTHGRTGVQHLSLGSVAETLVRLAPCDTLLVRGDHAPSFRRLLVALNGTASSQRAAARAMQVQDLLGGGRIDAVAAFELPLGWEMIAGTRDEHVARMRNVTEERVRVAKEALAEASPDGEHRLIEETARAAILQAAHDLDSEVVFAGAHNRPRWASVFLGDTARVIAHRLPCSVWFVRDPAEKHPVLRAILDQLAGA